MFGVRSFVVVAAVARLFVAAAAAGVPRVDERCASRFRFATMLFGDVRALGPVQRRRRVVLAE